MTTSPHVRSIEIIVSTTGAVRVQTRGFEGGTCRDASRALEAALGSRTAESLTGEFYSQTTHAELDEHT